jgi:hypothetical protein
MDGLRANRSVKRQKHLLLRTRSSSAADIVACH